MVEINVSDSLGPPDMEMYIFEKLGRPANFLSETGLNIDLNWPKLLPVSVRLKIIDNAMKAEYRKDFVEFYFQSIPLFEAKFLSLAMTSAPTLEHGFREISDISSHPAQWFNADFMFEGDRAVFTLYPRIEFGSAILPIVEGVIRHFGQHILIHKAARANEIFAYVSHEYDAECSMSLPFEVYYGQRRIAIELPTALAKARSSFFDPDLWQLVRLRNQRQVLESDLYNQVGIIEVQLMQIWLSTGRMPLIKEFAEFRGQSPRSLMRALRSQGLQFKALTDRLQAERAVELLRSGQFTIEAVAEILGFADSSSFRRSFRRWFRINPSDWRNQEVGNTILCTPVHSRFGPMVPRDSQNDAVKVE